MSHGADQAGQHHHGATNTYGFRPHYRNDNEHRRPAIGLGCCISLSVLGVFVAIVAILSIRFGLTAASRTYDNLSPNETRVISVVSPASCQSISVDTALVLQTGEMYLLSEEPSLTDHDSFQFHALQDFLTKYDYHNWNWRLYKNSTIKFSVCKLDEDSGFQYYIIKGTDNFKKWVANPSTAYAVDSGSMPNSSVCFDGPTFNYAYNVQKEDDYYVVFRKVPGTANDILQFDFDVYRTKYAVNPDKIISNCSLARFDEFGGCTLDISAHSFVFVALQAGPLVSDWTGTVFVNSECAVRVWIYIVTPFACIVGFGLIIACVMVCICCCCRGKSKYVPLREDRNLSPVVDDGPASTTATYEKDTTPPPFNPSYEAPPQYND